MQPEELSNNFSGRERLNIVNFNIRSASRNIDEFRQVLHNCEVSFSGIILTETWL